MPLLLQPPCPTRRPLNFLPKSSWAFPLVRAQNCLPEKFRRVGGATILAADSCAIPSQYSADGLVLF